MTETPAELDPFGGSDFAQIYPSEIKILEGQNQLETCIIREKSPIHRTYAKCCYTPLFSTGKTGAALFNSDLIPSEDQIEVKYRIIGRDALKGDGSVKKPPMSFSVPIGWFFVKPKRCRKDKVLTSPMEKAEEDGKVKVLEGFARG